MVTKDTQFSFEVLNMPDIDGETKPRRNSICKDGELLATFDDSVMTLYDNFQEAVKKYGTPADIPFKSCANA